MGNKPVYEELLNFHAIFENMRAGLHIYHLEDLNDDRTLRMISANQAAADLTGVSVEDVVGKTLDENFPGLRAKGIPQAYAEVARMGKEKTFEEVVYGDDRVIQGVFSVKAFPLPRNCVGVSFENVTEIRKAEEQLREKTYDLGERAKELNCLYGISSLSENRSLSLEETIQGVIDLIPPSCQYPEIACVRLVLEDQVFTTSTFRETTWKHGCEIAVDGGAVGTLEVCYLEERPERDEGPFLREERSLFNGIAERLGRIIEHKRAEEILKTSNRMLMAARQHDIAPLLTDLVAELKHFTGCAAVGIRLLDDDGNIPYQAYDGFSRDFYESESPLSIRSDNCMCINVIKGEFDAKLPFYTEGGSFYMNGTTNFLTTVSQEDKGETRNMCNRVGYESVALMPIRQNGKVLGLFHVADPREKMVPLSMVMALEGFGEQLGSVLIRIRSQAALKDREQDLISSAKRLEEVNTALNVMLGKRDEDKLMVEEKVLFNVKELIEPLIENLKDTGLDENQTGYVDALETFLADIVSPFSQTLHSKFLDLTLSEIRVANLIKEGKTTKEIARLLNSTQRAIEFHRQNIRKKLGLSNRRANLGSHLVSLLQ
ncbi:MAG: LuxR C-terminal-related transcriptional regulator [Desulfobacterales bacterium]